MLHEVFGLLLLIHLLLLHLEIDLLNHRGERAVNFLLLTGNISCFLSQLLVALNDTRLGNSASQDLAPVLLISSLR
jgi:hypothetical protein